jgi:hypothetical protein
MSNIKINSLRPINKSISYLANEVVDLYQEFERLNKVKMADFCSNNFINFNY